MEAIHRRRLGVGVVVEVSTEDRRLVPVTAAVKHRRLGRAAVGDEQIIDAVAVDVAAVRHGQCADGARDDRAVVAEQVDVTLPGRATAEQQVDAFLDKTGAGRGRARDGDGQIVDAVAVVVAACGDLHTRPPVVDRGGQQRAGQAQRDAAGLERLVAGGAAAEVDAGQALEPAGGVDVVLHRRDEVGVAVVVDVAERNDERLVGEVVRHQGGVGLGGRNLDGAAELGAEAQLVAAEGIHQVGRAQAGRQLQDAGGQGVGRDDLERGLAGEAAVDQPGQHDAAARILAGAHLG